ncbi:MAG: hypothetical protein Q9186_000756 [Xanthomendoza sp. 1 TL-2023]
MSSFSASDRDENGRDLPNGLSWAIWGIVDGHAGPYTASIVKELLTGYVVDELFLRAGINPRSRHRDTRTIFQNCSLQDTVQAITDAFLRLDNDILKLATQAITGSQSLRDSMHNLAPADSGSSALLAMWDTASGYLHVANVGNSRAVLGRCNAQGTWEAQPLSIDQTGCNEDEVARLQSEHPNEPEMMKDGRLLGLVVTRAFGDLRRFFGRPLLPFLLSPPYLTAEPQITTTKIDPKDNDFLILASDGFWELVSNDQAVQLVGRWLAKHDPATPPKSRVGTNTAQIDEDDEDHDDARRPGRRERIRNGDIVLSPSECAVKNREYTRMEPCDEKNWIVVDDNAATHLARNAMGGADEDLFCALAGTSVIYPMTRLRDDISIQVIFFGYGEPPSASVHDDDDDDDVDESSSDSIYL